jgi:hypothetical protein
MRIMKSWHVFLLLFGFSIGGGLIGGMVSGIIVHTMMTEKVPTKEKVKELVAPVTSPIKLVPQVVNKESATHQLPRHMGEWNAVQIVFTQKTVLKSITARHPSYRNAKIVLRDTDDLDNGRKDIGEGGFANEQGEIFV